jgi:ribosomal protein L37AE/L43A
MEEEMFCKSCQDRTTHKKDKEGKWVCEICGDYVWDEYEAESDEDTQIEEEDIF